MTSHEKKFYLFKSFSWCCLLRRMLKRSSLGVSERNSFSFDHSNEKSVLGMLPYWVVYFSVQHFNTVTTILLSLNHNQKTTNAVALFCCPIKFVSYILNDTMNIRKLMKDFPDFLVALFTDTGTKSRYFLSFWKLKNCFRNQFVSSGATDSKDVLGLKLEKVGPTVAQLFQVLKLCLQKIAQKI